jgi:hypothetical protein
MIGDTNTRFHWGQTASDPATVEPATPFQGTIYPDGHPWQTSEIQALTGSGYNSLPVLNVNYYNNTTFSGTPVKTSITPVVGFDLNTYQGTNSPDASAGVLSSGYGISWNGYIENVSLQDAGGVESADSFEFYLTSDNIGRLWIGSQEIINKESSGLSTVSASVKLTPNQAVPITVQYTHSATGPATMYIHWLSRSAKGNIIQIVPSTSP